MKVILRQDNNKNFIAYNENDKIIGYVINTKNISKGMGNIEMIIELNNVKSIFSGDVQLVKSNLVPNDEMWFLFIAR